MTNVALFNPSQVPEFAKNRKELSAVAKALAGGGNVGGGKRISIKGGVFRLNSAGKEVAAIEDRHLDVVIVNAAAKVGRQFYMKSYDGEASSPDCASNDGEVPMPDVPNKQSETCRECPKNIAGSGQGTSRACRYQHRLAVVLANDIEGDVMQLALPATSIFGKEDGDKRPLQAYARWLAAQNIDPSEVVTRMKFDTKSESPKLFFHAMRWLTDDEHPIAVKQGKTDDAIKAITMTVAKIDNVAPVAEPINIPGKKPKKVEAPVAQEDEEPVVRKEEKKPSAVPKAKAALADMVDDWDDE